MDGVAVKRQRWLDWADCYDTRWYTLLLLVQRVNHTNVNESSFASTSPCPKKTHFSSCLLVVYVSVIFTAAWVFKAAGRYSIGFKQLCGQPKHLEKRAGSSVDNVTILRGQLLDSRLRSGLLDLEPGNQVKSVSFPNAPSSRQKFIQKHPKTSILVHPVLPPGETVTIDSANSNAYWISGSVMIWRLKVLIWKPADLTRT